MDLPPPRPLNLVARQIWDRLAERIHGEGRWQLIDHEMLAVYAETSELHLLLKSPTLHQRPMSLNIRLQLQVHVIPA